MSRCLSPRLMHLLVLSLLLLLCPRAGAALLTYNFTLDGLQESSPNASPATGSAVVNFDTTTLALDWNISFTGLTAPMTAAHFHGPAALGVPAAVQVPISGLSSPLIGSTTINSTQAADLQAGLWYVNIHTSNFPAGEIRGQVVPEPAAFAALLLASPVLLLRRRR